MSRLVRIILVALGLGVGVASAADRSWENPVYHSAEEAVVHARIEARRLDEQSSNAQRLFVDLTLAEGDMPRGHSSSAMTREVVDSLLITHPTSFTRNSAQRRTIERFTREIPRQQELLHRRLARFGFPELPGMVFCRLVGDVDAFAGLNSSSDKMSRVGGVTYYCRYVVLPLSYVGDESLRELKRSAARNPSLDVDATISSWQRESYANLVNTFRHELVHVHTNSLLDVPAYSDRRAYPTWFHEGTATYLAGDPHAGLSDAYKEFQELFFYLAQRHGVARLQSFYEAILAGANVRSALDEVYGLSGADELFARAGRWHAAKDAAKTAFWIVALVLVVAAFRGVNLPLIGVLQLLVASVLGLAVATGFAEHLFGLRGPGVVLAAKIAFSFVAAAVALMAVRRVRRHYVERSA